MCNSFSASGLARAIGFELISTDLICLEMLALANHACVNSVHKSKGI